MVLVIVGDPAIVAQIQARRGGATATLTDGVPEAAMLVDARADGWCGRGAAEIGARFAVVPGKIAVRLH